MMRIPLLAAGLLLLLIGAVAYLESFTEDGKIKSMILAATGVICVVGSSIIAAIQNASRARLEAIARAQPAVAVAAEPIASPAKPTVVEDPGAHDLLKRAEDLHFAKKFPEALALYRKVVADYPDSKAAGSAKRQIENLA
jgi:hypothetical protein